MRVGSQEPRLSNVPAYDVTYGLEAVEFNAEIGHPLDPWQALLMLDACGVRSDKLWAAFEILLLLARQNGKGGFTEGIELAKLFLFKEPLILHSAHQFKTSTAAFRRLIDIIDGSDWLTKRVKMVSRSKGDESIELTRAAGGGRLQFIARTLGSGRGLTGSTTVIDEAAYLTIGQYAAQTPALSTIPNPQIIYTGTPPDDDVGPMPEDAMLPSVRKRAKAGDPRILYAEWSPGKDDDPESEETMYACNPAAGFRIGLWFLKQQLSNFKAAGRREKFVTEHLGAWPDDADEQWKIVTEQDWTDAGQTDSRVEGGRALGISMTDDRSLVYIGFCGLRKDGKRHIGLKQMLYGSEGVVEAVKELKKDPKAKVCAVVIGANDPARSLIPDFKAAKIDVLTPGTADVAAECGAVYDGLRETEESPRDMFHSCQEPLKTAMAAAGKKLIANSWVWARGTVAPAPLYAVTAASYGFRVSPPSNYDPLNNLW